jgi:hypothetical protein
MWTSFGMVLGVLLRQSAMAIGAGLVYSIAIEGLIFALQAVLVLAAYAVAFVAIAGAIARGRDVTN